MQQVVTQRRGGQAVVGGRGKVGGIPQKPVRRERPNAPVKKKLDLRQALTYLPWVGRVVVAIVIGLVLFAGYRAAASAKFFNVKNIDVTGTARVSTEDIRAIVRRDTAHVGVWNADVTAIRKDLEQVPWIRTASVSRVLPDGLRIRVTERLPYAVVHSEDGKFVWVDQDAVMLGSLALQRDELPPFFLRGWDTGWGASAANLERLELYRSILAKWQELGLASQVSELDLSDPKNLVVSLNGEHSKVSVKLLTPDYGEGLRRAIDKLNTAPNSSEITSIVVQTNRTVLNVSQTGADRVAGNEGELEPRDRQPGANGDVNGESEPNVDGGTGPAKLVNTKGGGGANAKPKTAPGPARSNGKSNASVKSENQGTKSDSRARHSN